MRRSLFIVALCTGLVGCGTEGLDSIGTIKDFGTVASGSIKEAKGQIDSMMQMGKSMTDGITDSIEDAKKRIIRDNTHRRKVYRNVLTTLWAPHLLLNAIKNLLQSVGVQFH